MIDFNASWLRDMRTRLGWSTTTTADRAKAVADEFGDPIKISQQLVSKFENGRFKSVPRWLGYVQQAMAVELNDKGWSTEGVWSLRLPREMKRFFEEQTLQRNTAFDPFPDDDLSHQERAHIEHLRSLSAEDQEAFFRIAKLAAREAVSRLAPST